MKMRKLSYLFLLIFIVACKTNTATKLDNKTERVIKGKWQISSVNFIGSEYFKINAFDLADVKCFENSTWNFVSNNNTGDFTLSNTSCTGYRSKITWFINKEGNFVMKILDDGIKSKRVKEGYVLRVANVSDNSFQLIDKAQVGNNTADVVYQFVKM
jgi:CRISPR/Cas system CMR-associated protein Cmr1 (group 7 of RAMP superfamily)